MAICIIISVDEDIVQIQNNKDIKLFSKDFINIFLEACWHVCQSERHYLVLKVAVSSPERGFLFVSFADSHSIVYTGKIELGKFPSSF